MVLENASAAAATDSFEDNPPASTDDQPYASSKPGTYTIAPYAGSNFDGMEMHTYIIDTNNLAKPLPVLGALFGFNQKYYNKLLMQDITDGSRVLHRPLTQDEVNAFSYHTAKEMFLSSLGPPLGVSAGFWRCYSTADTFRFPFQRQNPETFNPHAFPPAPPGGTSFLTGSRAVKAWHALRLLAYGSVGYLLGKLFFGSYATTVSLVGELSDKRLNPYFRAQQEEYDKRRGVLKTGMGKSQPRDINGLGGSQQKDSRKDQEWSNTQADRFPPQTQSEPRWPSKPVPGQGQVESSPDQTFGMFDDTSPTGGQVMQADIRAAPAVTPKGSAWDRIRRGEQGAGTEQRGRSAWQKRQDDSSQASGNDSFAFSKTEEEKSYAKDEGLKEFEALIERERARDQLDGDERRW
ncbi:hypothetical protein QTJ16_004373 [Diplocarpon rosae]|uniref:Uncharacterized protein n=1 Tax=Diplocarpon rosae TaxID=946125 RepID=A0AAD9SYT7_9HELO|nr:hypothetical protein QTJ16_004373 [Diplocarpon rosae]